jgi:hypothetical protein
VSFTNVCRYFACGMGKFVGESLSALVSFQKALGKSVEKLRPLPSRKKIRTMVTEELAACSMRL